MHLHSASEVTSQRKWTFTWDSERSARDNSARFIASMKFGMRPIEEDILGEMSSTMRDSTNSGRDSERHITVLPGSELEMKLSSFYIRTLSAAANDNNFTRRRIGNQIATLSLPPILCPRKMPLSSPTSSMKATTSSAISWYDISFEWGLSPWLRESNVITVRFNLVVKAKREK